MIDTKTLGKCACGAVVKARDTPTSRALGYPAGERWWEAPPGKIGHQHEVAK